VLAKLTMDQGVRNLVRSSVSISPEEVKAEFLRKGRQVNLEYIRFASRRQEADVAPTDAELADYASKNEAKLKEMYEQKKFLYEKAPAQRRIRQIVIKLPADADEKANKAAKEKAEALAEKLKKGGKLTFADAAKQSSDDPASKGRGGDLGWRARGGTNLHCNLGVCVAVESHAHHVPARRVERQVELRDEGKVHLGDAGGRCRHTELAVTAPQLRAARVHPLQRDTVRSRVGWRALEVDDEGGSRMKRGQ